MSGTLHSLHACHVCGKEALLRLSKDGYISQYWYCAEHGKCQRCHTPVTGFVRTHIGSVTAYVCPCVKARDSVIQKQLGKVANYWKA